MKQSKYDVVETLPCGSHIQHGPFNDRIYLMKASDSGIEDLPLRLRHLAEEEGYGKIFAKLPESLSTDFREAGFQIEAEIPNFYRKCENGLFLAYFNNASRKREKDIKHYLENIHLALKKQKGLIKPLNPHFRLRQCRENDLKQMAEIYRKVFPSYPFPIHETAYLQKTMQGNVDYYGVETRGKLIALASAEKDFEAGHAEMTDFATLPERRGYGLALHLLRYMENTLPGKGIHSVFTIARAASPGMNITFAKSRYTYAGRLVNNTNISGRIESMNIWYKYLKSRNI
ncbi:MAG: putative beta-lysine N-acetyltransferase [Candidatus Neomarinimicrobiota bacterium]|jgi:putative beta-lysine N-acetyltransferase|nr:putative beta-lysine N-acetyltransferase [Candidatus Neomarinimicrobiota bacterium]MDD3966563.1 putative beta-lysine N-acetyltransferase [Candidatus Neomarinimicrobiota bacterium]MDX9780434.1 putative beta-lysine N-acetyltransferase [bacterium]